MTVVVAVIHVFLKKVVKDADFKEDERCKSRQTKIYELSQITTVQKKISEGSKILVCASAKTQ